MKKLIRKYRKSKGFTLVELLIVIIIIGILAGMMMLSSGSATDKAEATKIVSNMRNIKSACLMYYADNGTWPGASVDIAGLENYLDAKVPDGYTLNHTSGLNVKYKAPSGVSAGVLTKLGGMAKDAGLYSSASASTDYTGTGEVFMRVKKQ